MHIIATQEAPQAIGPYSAGHRHQRSGFTLGQIPLTAAGEIVAGSIQTQTEQVFDNLEAVLRSAGSALNQAVFGHRVHDRSAAVSGDERNLCPSLRHTSPARSTVRSSRCRPGRRSRSTPWRRVALTTHKKQETLSRPTHPRTHPICHRDQRYRPGAADADRHPWHRHLPATSPEADADHQDRRRFCHGVARSPATRRLR